jgi:hypothetical protein
MITFAFPDEYKRVQCGKVPLRSGRIGFDKLSAQVDQKKRSGCPGLGALKDNRSRLDCSAMPDQDLPIFAALCGIESVLF